MIEIKNLSKKYGKIEAIKNLNFSVKKGEIMGFLGPNGAGKSTTMKIITGFIAPSQGTVVVDGLDILDDENKVKKKIGYLPENPPLYSDMTVSEFLNFACRIKGVRKSSTKSSVREVMEMLNIDNVSNRLIKNLSKGYKQRIGLAQAILGNPDVLILDEPTIGLDPAQIIEIRDLIKKLGKDRTIILSTHILPEVSQLCDRVAIINKGEIIAIDSPENLSKKIKESNVIEARIIGPQADVMSAIEAVDGVIRVGMIGEKEKGTTDYRIETGADVDLRQELLKVMVEHDFKMVELRTVELSLEDVFLHLITTEGEGFVQENEGKVVDNEEISKKEEEVNE